MNESVKVTAEQIRKLQIQGARNVAIAAIKAIQKLAETTTASTRKDFLAELGDARTLLFASRETEPLMRNAVRWIITRVEDSDERKVTELSRVVCVSSENFQKSLANSKERIAEIGSKRILDGSTVFTHCHSSTATHMLWKAKDEGKTFQVICTETRPAFQGRITAKEMLSLGLKTTFIVDSAARSFMHDADIVIVGADAITSEGNVINKIGTASIALLAHESRKPFYVVSELLKFDPATLYGDYEKIEERSREEIWKESPTELNVRNPAFDVTPRDLIHGIICEEGIVSPHSVAEVMHRIYPWVFE
ncbi:MAG TPA: S-methyl-5-thioribose-1-phosphate isomerase [Candidatus Nanoarchaeia archaeon]|nr:S-methyl-5-thioribose-1-phosphate isomerase [Candidatus Nanoarchaeia archaeon]